VAVYGYCRVSAMIQADEGESLEAQARRIEGYAHMQGLPLARTFIDRGVSGSKPLAERPQGEALLAALQTGDVVITADLDRMFRSALDAQRELHSLHERKIELHAIRLGLGNVLTNGHARVVFGILAAVAEGERDRIRERISQVKADQKARSRYLGGSVPFGYQIGEDRALVPVPEQQAALALMRRLRAEGLSLRAIADRLRATGHKISHMGVKAALAEAAGQREAA
jgi:putative DNA-invertase from lambdoid prophage Rac